MQVLREVAALLPAPAGTPRDGQDRQYHGRVDDKFGSAITKLSRNGGGPQPVTGATATLDLAAAAAAGRDEQQARRARQCCKGYG